MEELRESPNEEKKGSSATKIGISYCKNIEMDKSCVITKEKLYVINTYATIPPESFEINRRFCTRLVFHFSGERLHASRITKSDLHITKSDTPRRRRTPSSRNKRSRRRVT